MTTLLNLSRVLSPDPGDWKLKKAKRKDINGRGAVCLELRSKAENEARGVCLDSTTFEVLSDETSVQDSFASHTRRTFSNYQDFGGHRYPQQFKLEKDGATKIDAKVVSLKEMTFPDSTFLPPPGAIVQKKRMRTTEEPCGHKYARSGVSTSSRTEQCRRNSYRRNHGP